MSIFESVLSMFTLNRPISAGPVKSSGLILLRFRGIDLGVKFPPDGSFISNRPYDYGARCPAA